MHYKYELKKKQKRRNDDFILWCLKELYSIVFFLFFSDSRLRQAFEAISRKLHTLPDANPTPSDGENSNPATPQLVKRVQLVMVIITYILSLIHI